MKYSFLILIILTINSTLFAQGILKTVPEKPYPGDVVKFTYTPPEELANEELPLNCIVYRFGNYTDLFNDAGWNGKPLEMQLIKEGSVYSGEVPTTSEMQGLVFSFAWGSLKFEPFGRSLKLVSGKMDNNKEKGYFTPLYTNNNKPCQTAYTKMANYISTSFINGLGISNPQLAREYYFTEMGNYPEKTSALLILIARTFDPENDTVEIENLAKKYLEKTFEKGLASEADYLACQTLFRMLKLKATAQYFGNFPRQARIGDYSYCEDLYTRTQEETDLNNKKILLDSTIAGFNQMDYYTRSMTFMAGGALSGLISDYLIAAYKTWDKNSFEKALHDYKWDLNGGANELSLYLELVQDAIKNERYDEALNLNSIYFAECQNRHMQLKGRPDDYKTTGSSDVYFTKNKLTEIYFLDMIKSCQVDVEIFLQKGECEKALEKLDIVKQYLATDEAKELGIDKYAKNTLDPLAADIYVKCRPLKEATKYLEQIIATGTYNDKMVELLKELYIKKNGNDTGFLKYQMGLRETNEGELKVKLKESAVNETAPDFNLADMYGENVKLSDLKGKTVILDFWATWCGPCKASFPAMQQLVDYYKSDPNVVFLFVNTFERGAKGDLHKMQAGAKALMEKERLSFQVVFDTKDEVAAKYKVTGIPAKFVIDNTGTMRYKAVGGGYFSNLVDEMVAMIESVKTLGIN